MPRVIEAIVPRLLNTAPSKVEIFGMAKSLLRAATALASGLVPPSNYLEVAGSRTQRRLSGMSLGRRRAV